MSKQFKDYLDNQRQVSLEELIDGGAHPEVAFRFYAECSDFDWTSSAIRKEVIEQWLLPLDGIPVVRATIRCVDNTRHIISTSLKRGQAIEVVHQDITMDLFNHLKAGCLVGHRKTRYTMPITPGSKIGPWVVDVFLTNGGAPSTWVKLDVDVGDIHAEVPLMPFEPKHVIHANDTDLAEPDQRQIRRLWGGEWVEIDATRHEPHSQREYNPE